MFKNVLQRNIDHLAIPSQNDLARRMNLPGIGQRYISDVVRGRKSFSPETVRTIERNLSIPAGWLDRYLFDSKTLVKLHKYRKLDSETQMVFDELSLHMIEKETVEDAK